MYYFRPLKRKLSVSKGIQQKSVKKMKKLRAGVKDLSASLSVSEAEKLAMQLLQSRK